jgi:hypothetical protein
MLEHPLDEPSSTAATASSSNTSVDSLTEANAASNSTTQRTMHEYLSRRNGSSFFSALSFNALISGF